MYRFAVIALFLHFQQAALSQQKKIVFDHYAVPQGFNSRVCRTVVKTPDGMVWITTDNGLVRYDSKKFRYFQHDPADSTSLSSDFTDQMVADKEGKLWIVAEGGLDIFNPQTEKFSHTYLINEGTKRKDFNPESLYYDSANNRIWAGTWMGLYYCNPGSTEFVKAKTGNKSGEVIKRVFIDIKPWGSKGLWLCNSQGFYKYDFTTGNVEIFHAPEQTDKLHEDAAFCLFPEDDETLWIGTWTRGLIRYDLKLNTWKHFYYSDYTKEQNAVTFVCKTGLKNEEHILWISTPNKGLTAFDKQTGTFRSFYSELQNDKNGINALTNRLLPTASEGMWIASENGLHRYDYSKQLFAEINLSLQKPEFQKAFPLEHISIPLTGAGKDSFCVFDVPYLGVYQYVFGKNEIRQLPEALNKLLSVALFATYIDAAGAFWAGTDKNGLVGYDLATGKFIFPPGQHFTNDWEWVTGFYEDKSNRLWLATYKGLFIIDKSRIEMTAVDVVNNELSKQGLSLNIQGIAADEAGRIWIITGSNDKSKNAIVVLDDKKNNARVYSEKQNKKDRFPADAELNSITSCGSRVYVATSSGLLILKGDESNPQFEILTNKNGLIGNNLAQVICDRRSNIWCSTEFGVSCYIPSKNFFINYPQSSSGIGSQKMPAMYLSPNTGSIYLCQQGLLNCFNPDEIAVEAMPRIHFSGMQVFNKPFLYNNKQIADGDIIRLNHDQNMISVEFTGMSFRNPDDNQFAYRLDGLEDEWIVSKNNIASYTNLAPGKYKLFVKVSNSSGVWSAQPAVITFIIRPPFWKTWWFISLIGLFVAGSLYALYRYRINKVMEMQKMRNSISRNLHDEIGSTLTSISILSNVSQQAMDKEPQQAKEMLQKIADQSKSIQQNMSDIVWAIRSDNDKIENLLVRMREYAAQTLEQLNIRTHISINESLFDKMLSLEARKEVLLIFKEAVNNIAKHSGASEVSILVRKNDRHLILEIKDNGKWKGSGYTSGTGVGSIKLRATSLGGKAEIIPGETGTTVSVEIPIT